MISKAWKMSASVIIAQRLPVVRDSLKTVGSACRPSKTNHSFPECSNLHILSLRRGESDRHLPGIHVFPGGHLDEADTSPDWIYLYKSLGFEESSFVDLSTGGGIECHPEYQDMGSACLPGWMSLRLCAIRETFEECGILLCRNPSSIEQGLPYASFVIVNELSAWQNRVRADPRQMLALCHTAGCVPDVWGLHLWSNWLTPTQQKVRHNSTVFLAVLRSLPTYSINLSEMDELKCCSAYDLINLAHSGNVRLANPQFYEAVRLTNFADADALSSFAYNRAQLGCQQIMPVQEKTRNGMLFIFPGDSAYPKIVDCETPRNLVKREQSLEELSERVKASSGTLHRLEVPTSGPCQRIITHNYIPPFKHILPSIAHGRWNGTKSHL